jgi:hypothetical protein
LRRSHEALRAQWQSDERARLDLQRQAIASLEARGEFTETTAVQAEMAKLAGTAA